MKDSIKGQELWQELTKNNVNKISATKEFYDFFYTISTKIDEVEPYDGNININKNKKCINYKSLINSEGDSEIENLQLKIDSLWNNTAFQETYSIDSSENDVIFNTKELRNILTIAEEISKKGFSEETEKKEKYINYLNNIKPLIEDLIQSPETTALSSNDFEDFLFLNKNQQNDSSNNQNSNEVTSLDYFFSTSTEEQKTNSNESIPKNECNNTKNTNRDNINALKSITKKKNTKIASRIKKSKIAEANQNNEQTEQNYSPYHLSEDTMKKIYDVLSINEEGKLSNLIVKSQSQMQRLAEFRKIASDKYDETKDTKYQQIYILLIDIIHKITNNDKVRYSKRYGVKYLELKDRVIDLAPVYIGNSKKIDNNQKIDAAINRLFENTDNNNLDKLNKELLEALPFADEDSVDDDSIEINEMNNFANLAESSTIIVPPINTKDDNNSDKLNKELLKELPFADEDSVDDDSIEIDEMNNSANLAESSTIIVPSINTKDDSNSDKLNKELLEALLFADEDSVDDDSIEINEMNNSADLTGNNTTIDLSLDTKDKITQNDTLNSTNIPIISILIEIFSKLQQTISKIIAAQKTYYHNKQQIDVTNLQSITKNILSNIEEIQKNINNIDNESIQKIKELITKLTLELNTNNDDEIKISVSFKLHKIQYILDEIHNIIRSNTCINQNNQKIISKIQLESTHCFQTKKYKYKS